MSLGLAALLALLLIVVLFAAAAAVEYHAASLRARPRLRHLAYTLGLGVYCSSWTFYGAVGSAVREGWNYLPIYLAPCLVMLLAPGFLRRLADAVHAERATTISDFIAARFGHDPGMARLVTIIALCGIVPYGALQLRSIGSAMAVITAADIAVPVMVATSLILALFAILFGARRYELAGRSEGLVYAIGLESVIKIVALTAVAAVAVVLLVGADAGIVLACLEGVDHAVDIDIECGLSGVVNGLAGTLLCGCIGVIHEPAGSAAAVELEDDALKALVLADAHVGHRELGGGLRPEGLHFHVGLA